MSQESTKSPGRGWRAFAREIFTGLGGANTNQKRLRFGGWVRLLVILPLVVGPTLVSVLSIGGESRNTEYPQALTTVWAVSISVWLAATLGILFSNGRSARLERCLSYVCALFELWTNHLILYAIGTLSGAPVINLAVVSVVYRIFFDFRFGLFSALVGTSLFAGTGVLEILGVLPVAPSLPEGSVLAAYQDPTISWSTIVATSASLLFVFTLVNYSVNQALKLHRYITESVLQRYLPPSLVSKAAEGELSLDAPPERRVITVLFTDLVGFTSLSERLGPESIGELLNVYLTEMCAIAHRHEATVDKFIGDCIMIVFGAPETLPEEEQAIRCVRLAMELQASVPLLAGVPLQARTGINTGEAVIGNFGSLVRSDYTVLGPAVNLAARLETASKPGRILIGPETARLIGDRLPLESAGLLTLKGVSEPIEAWWVVAEVPELRCVEPLDSQGDAA